MPREFIIGNRIISDDSAPYVIAEIGGNHQGSVAIAQQMVRKAAQCGASAVKFQCRDANLYSQALKDKPYENENSFGKTYGEHRAALELSTHDLAMTQLTATRSGVQWFATAFDEPSADKLVSLSVPAIKLASGALTDTVLQKHVASLGLPVLLSTGGGTERDIERAVDTITSVVAPPRLALLHCTAAYPQKPEDANLRYIGVLRQRFPELVIGFSSHLPGPLFSLVAYALGASIFEHHFTLDRSMKGGDHAFSLEPNGLAKLVEDLGKLRVGMGDGIKRFMECEKGPIAKTRRVPTAHGWQITGELLAHD